ncbi:hypothetical protein N7G274_001983 [Stereocaulon virgatum]|uniref:Uncharacterized protein n=1 Tax=Stereocaulon virgatum TaxID=373712 RepID=A0ABR4AK46_9LECA
MDTTHSSNARLLAGVQVLQAHTYTKFDRLQQEVETLAHQYKLSNGSLRLAIDMLPLVQHNIATNGAQFAPMWATMHQNTTINLISIRSNLENMETRMYEAMKCTKEMRELSKFWAYEALAGIKARRFATDTA